MKEPRSGAASPCIAASVGDGYLSSTSKPRPCGHAHSAASSVVYVDESPQPCAARTGSDRLPPLRELLAEGRSTPAASVVRLMRAVVS